MCDPISAGVAITAGASLYQGVQGYRAGQQNAQLINQQNAMERQLSAIEDQRTRQQMRSQLASQRASFVARGVQLDSPTAAALGDVAAREISFASQSIRSGAQARSQELDIAAYQSRQRGTNALFTGISSAAGSILRQAPDIWPGLSGGGISSGSGGLLS